MNLTFCPRSAVLLENLTARPFRSQTALQGFNEVTLRLAGTTINVYPGNVNEDASVNLLDVAPFVNLLTSGEYLIQADINCDGQVDLLDVNPFAELLAN